MDYRLTDIVSNVQDWVYRYDLNSNIDSITHNTDTLNNQAYGYDELNRLTSASGPYGDYTYQYDAVGNRTQRQKITTNTTTVEDLTYATDANQLDTLTTTVDTVQTDSRLFTYSPSGQLITDINNERTIDFSYDENDRLAQVDVFETANHQATYKYNPLGQRVIKNAGGEIQHIHYNSAGQRIAETDANGNVIREYIYLGQQAIAMVVAGPPSEPNSGLYYVHNDHLGTPKILTDAQGAIVWAVHTTPFGEVHEEIANGLSNIQAFPGQYTDSETGLNYNYYRDYDPTIGRYIQSDPIGLGGGLNTYGYALQNPVGLTDPNGLNPLAACLVPPIAAGCVAALESAATYSISMIAGIIGGVAIYETGTSYYNDNQSKPERTADQEAAAQGAHDWYKHICQQKPPQTGDKCTDLKSEIDRAEMCAMLMQQFDDNYGTAGRHEGDITREWNRAQRKRQQYRYECKPNPFTSFLSAQQCKAE